MKKKLKKTETAKVMLFFVMLTYFVAVGVGTFAILKILMEYPEYAIQGLIAYFGFIGGTTGATVSWYNWKAKAENVLKIPNYIAKEADEKREQIDKLISSIGGD